MLDHRFEGVKHVSYQREDYIFVRPAWSRDTNARYSRCEIVLLIARDFGRVLVGGGEYGFDSKTVREADELEIEALAERFEVPELRRVLERRRSSG